MTPSSRAGASSARPSGPAGPVPGEPPDDPAVAPVTPRGRARRLRVPAWTSTLYWKFAVTIAAVCCAVGLVLSLLVHGFAARQSADHARGDALSRLDGAALSYTRGEPLTHGAGIDPDGLPAGLRALAARGERGTMLAYHRGRPVMWAAGPADGKALAVRVDYSRSAGAISSLDRAILGSAALAVGVTALAGLFVAYRISRRLQHTARVARRISAGDLDARVGDPGKRRRGENRARDEVAAVSDAMDSMASALQDRLRSEQRFTADVAHELRTPLTGLHAAAELLPPGRPTELVRDRVQALRKLTEDLLEISRLDAAAERANLDIHRLGPLVGQAVRGTGLEARVEVVRDALVETDRRRLDRIIGNLVANAHRHGGPPVVITVDGPVVTVRDHGDGYPDELLAQGPRRFRTESTASGKKGHGLGLTIAVGQAAVLDADLVFSNAPDGGAVTTIALRGGTAPEPVADPGGAGEPAAGQSGTAEPPEWHTVERGRAPGPG